MRFPLRLQASALLLAMVMPLAQAAEDDSDATVESLRQDVQSLNQELSDFTAERRDQLMADIEDVLGAIDARVATLENRLEEGWGDADKIARAQAQTALASLHRERARVTEWHQRMQDSADFTWESMKEGFNDAFDKLSEAWQNAEKSVGQALEED
ncbi:hypothetical protein EHN06_15680 [Marinobacter sp. NP-4(2019)]|uniref:hypothetical protein n=1 Tax=Marinobacter sp. NP-4(2019) TaxID=2488665 RepID=UPI000FC3F331|nr:hypothetical protein [Marinobacter sp. NP-4(2019)]AZT84874.1 hypothetical protein EHN06_15680 [Marinobacter sp. NP-4(2019)]